MNRGQPIYRYSLEACYNVRMQNLEMSVNTLFLMLNNRTMFWCHLHFSVVGDWNVCGGRVVVRGKLRVMHIHQQYSFEILGNSKERLVQLG